MKVRADKTASGKAQILAMPSETHKKKNGNRQTFRNSPKDTPKPRFMRKTEHDVFLILFIRKIDEISAGLIQIDFTYHLSEFLKEFIYMLAFALLRQGFSCCRTGETNAVN